MVPIKQFSIFVCLVKYEFDHHLIEGSVLTLNRQFRIEKVSAHLVLVF